MIVAAAGPFLLYFHELRTPSVNIPMVSHQLFTLEYFATAAVLTLATAANT